MTTITCIEDEIRLNWQEEPEGVQRFLTACHEGTIRGATTVSLVHPHIGCAYGHIRGLNREKAHNLIDQRRAQCRRSDRCTPLEVVVSQIQPEQTVLNNERVRALHDLIVVLKPV